MDKIPRNIQPTKTNSWRNRKSDQTCNWQGDSISNQKLSPQKAQNQMYSLENYTTILRRINGNYFSNFQKFEENTLKLILKGQHYPDAKATQRQHKKRLCMLCGFWLFATPWTRGCQDPLFVAFPRQKHWSGLPFSSTGDLLNLPNPGNEPTSLTSPTSPDWQADYSSPVPLGKPTVKETIGKYHLYILIKSLHNLPVMQIQQDVKRS